MKKANPVAGVLAIVWLLAIATPIYAAMVTAARPPSKYITSGPLAPPTDLTLDNFRLVLEGDFVRYVVNTIIVAVATVLLVLVLAMPLAYAIVRGSSRVSLPVFRMFLVGLAVPAQAVIVPVFYLINELGLYDTYWAVVLPTAAFSMPVSVLILVNGLRDVPAELYEAIGLDGAGAFKAFTSLALPLSKGSIMTVAIFTALNAWNGFLFPLILTQSQEVRVVTVGLYDFVGQYSSNIPALLASVLMSTTPVLLLYLVARKALVRGLAGAGGK